MRSIKYWKVVRRLNDWKIESRVNSTTTVVAELALQEAMRKTWISRR